MPDSITWTIHTKNILKQNPRFVLIASVAIILGGVSLITPMTKLVADTRTQPNFINITTFLAITFALLTAFSAFLFSMATAFMPKREYQLRGNQLTSTFGDTTTELTLSKKMRLTSMSAIGHTKFILAWRWYHYPFAPTIPVPTNKASQVEAHLKKHTTPISRKAYSTRSAYVLYTLGILITVVLLFIGHTLAKAFEYGLLTVR